MAINPSTNSTMTGRVTAADANYPYASAKDETSPGAGDGTPYFKARADDIFGFQQAVLRAASIVPSGNADTALASEYLQGLIELMLGRASVFDESGVADAYVLDLRANQQAPASLFDGMVAKFVPGNVNTGASTVNVVSLGVKSIKNRAGLDLIAGDLNTTRQYELRYDLTNDWFVLESAKVHCLAIKTNSQNITSGVKTTLSMDDESFDSGGIHDNTTNTSRMTVPSGFTEARVVARAQISVDTVGGREIIIDKNGSGAYHGAGKLAVKGNINDSTRLHTSTGWLPVTGGDYFEVAVVQDSGSTLSTVAATAGNETWIYMEVR